MSLIDKIKNASDLKTVDVEVPEWDVTITLREMSGLERAKFENDIKGVSESDDSSEMIRSMSLLIVRCAVDKDMKSAFTEEDINILSTKSMAILQLLFNKALEINSLNDGDIDDLEKN